MLFIAFMVLPLGVYMGGASFFSFDGEFPSALSQGFVGGVIIVVVLGAISALFKFDFGGRVAYGKTNWSHIYELRLDSEEAEELCKRSLDSLKRKIKPDSSAQNQRNVTVRTGMTRRSWGETISFKISNLRTAHVQIDISSRPTWKMTKVDWGANRMNIEAVCRFIENAVAPEKILKSERIPPLE